MKTANEILDKWDWSNKAEIISAMDQYAKELVLLEWRFCNGYPISYEITPEQGNLIWQSLQERIYLNRLSGSPQP